MKKDYQLSEHRAVEDFSEYGAEIVPLSGAGPTEKLDITFFAAGKLWCYRMSNKHTKQKSVSFKLEDLQKDEKQARFHASRVIRRIEFEDPVTGKLKKYILLEQDLFKDLICEES